MKKSVKNIIQVLIGFVIGAYFLYITLREQNFEEIMTSLKDTDITWALLGGVSLLAVFLLRAFRWKVILNNSGVYPKSVDVVNSIALGYFVNSFTPKFGELVRCTNLKRTDNVKVSRVLGTVVSERVWDLLILAVGLVIIIMVEFERVTALFNMNELLSGFKNGTLVLALILLGGGVALIVVYRLIRNKIKDWKIVKYLTNFVTEIYSTIMLTFKIKEYKKFLVLTVLIWVALVLMNYCFLRSLSEGAEFSNMYFAIVVLFIGAIGWALPSPGGIGTTHYFILQLFIAFELSESAGVNFGILSNGLNFVYTIFVGFVALIYNEVRVYRIKKQQDMELQPVED